MFVLEVVTLLTTALLIRNIVMGHADFAFELQITIWLWFTVLFANFAEAVAEGGEGAGRYVATDSHGNPRQAASVSGQCRTL
jgi:high-affinity K+ transport system ATPase subunit B